MPRFVQNNENILSIISREDSERLIHDTLLLALENEKQEEDEDELSIYKKYKLLY